MRNHIFSSTEQPEHFDRLGLLSGDSRTGI